MRRTAGFTLIEILVVVAIIAAMLGGISLMIGKASGARTRLAASGQVSTLGAAIERLASPEQLGMYPPTRLEMLIGPGSMGPVGKRLGNGGNDTNCGIETVYVAVRLKGVNVPVEGFDSEDAIKNLDDDKANEAAPGMANATLYEYIDPWGNPLVYINSRDYKDMKKVEQYVLGDGQVVKVAPRMLPNGEFARATTFQLFSMGPDGVPGTEDDLPYGQ